MRSVALAFSAAAALPAGLPPVWRAGAMAGGDGSAPATASRPSGFAVLDAELPGGGWPGAGLTEWLLAAPGGGEWALTAATWARVAPGEPAVLLCAAPPFVPYAPALAAQGLAPERLLVVPADATASSADAAWSAEQALRSGACAAVLWWTDEWRHAGSRSLPTTLRRLHLAAQEGATPLIALRPLAARAQASPAPLRLMLEPQAPGRLALTLFKRRGPPMVAPLVLTLPAVSPRWRREAQARLPPSLHDAPHAVVRPAPAVLAA
jgi:protein ImuA